MKDAGVLPKAEDENGQSARVMQNPSDLEAGYDGHKGPGYQVQISQAYDIGEEGPGIIVSCLPQSAAVSDSASLEAVYEQQERMETLPPTLLADTAYGGQAHVEMSAVLGVTLVSPAGGAVEKTSRESASCETQGNVRKFTAAEEKKIALDQRRAEQETPEWKKQYAKRSGVEGVHEALDRKTGIKALKVRGGKAVAMAVFFKVAGWNICAAAKIALARNKKAEKASGKQNISTNHASMRPQPAGLCRRKPARAHEPRFFRRQSGKIALVGQNSRIRHFVFAPASDTAECFHAVRDFSTRVRFEI